MCGIAGVFGHDNAAEIVYNILWRLQHRGQEAAGIATTNNRHVHSRVKPGTLSQAFYARKTLDSLVGSMGIGHLRYSTSGDKHQEDRDESPQDGQPICYHDRAIAHNGNLTNGKSLRERLISEGRTFVTQGSDTEVIMQLASASQEKTVQDKFIDALQQVEGAYSITVMWENQLVVARDPYGYRPLAVGRLNGATIVGSEMYSLEAIGATECREVNEGELLIINDDGISSYEIAQVQQKQRCVFELVYFGLPAGRIFGLDMDGWEIRKEHGRILARSDSNPLDVIIPAPDSGMAAALGYAAERGIPYDMGFLRSHAAGRTFIEPEQALRERAVVKKLMPVRSVIEGQRVGIVDDSIVRSTTSRKMVELLRQYGAAEVHMRVSSPPTKWPCFYGMDTPRRSQLIASEKNVEDIRKAIGADSLQYLNMEGLLKPLTNKNDYCHACFSGQYADNLADMTSAIDSKT
jgi:amidophosphoribosyltransferase